MDDSSQGVGAAAGPVAARGSLDRHGTFWLMLGLATLVGALLRLHRLDAPSFWVDEFFTIARAGAAELSWVQYFGYLPTKLSLWLHGADLGRISFDNVADWQALGVSERAARLGACWVGIVTIPVLGLLVRPVAGAGVAGVGALLLALTPWHIYWSQMARFYTTKFLFAGLFVLLFARAMQTGRKAGFAGAACAAVLAYLSHPTAVFVVGACIAAVGLAWITRQPQPHLTRGIVTLAGITLVCGVSVLVNSMSSAGSFSGQSWDPPLRTLVLGTLLRIEPVTVVAALAAALIAIRRRDPFGILLTSVALLVPLGLFALKGFFPVAPRYYFPCLFAWVLLAASWVVEVDRRLTGSAGRVAGLSGLGILLVAVSFSTFVYVRDGAGARPRWREAYAHVGAHAAADDRVYVNAGSFQARYYLGRGTSRIDSIEDVSALAPGTWVVERSRGSQPPRLGKGLEWRARYEIPSKPWSWVLNVMRVPSR